MMAKGSVEEPSPLPFSLASASATNLNERELRDLNKFVKFLAFKSVQVIVQSRSGEKIDSASKAKSDGTDWFSLAIYDNPSIKSNIKKLLAQELPRVGSPLNVEVSLETNDGDRMVLECWSLVLNETSEPNTKIHYAVYNRLGLLLKSLICITRVTPAYRIARHQLGADYRVISRMCFGEMKLSVLGENFHSLNVGAVATPMGSIVLSVAYRTKLTLSVHQLNATGTSPISVRDDHYGNCSPKHRGLATVLGHGQPQGLEDSSLMDGSQDLCATSFSTSPPDPCLLHAEHMTSPPGRSKVAEDHKPKGGSPSLGAEPLSGKLGAFASQKHPTDQSDIAASDIPFLSLLIDHTALSSSSKEKSSSSEQTSFDQPDVQASSSSQHSKESSQSQQSGVEDFVMVELNPAFAKPEGNSDVVSFYRQFQLAPPLSLFDSQPTLEETLEVLPEQIAKYERNRADFDSFVQTLQQDSDSSD